MKPGEQMPCRKCVDTVARAFKPDLVDQIVGSAENLAAFSASGFIKVSWVSRWPTAKIAKRSALSKN